MDVKISISDVLVFLTLMVTYWMQRQLVEIMGYI